MGVALCCQVRPADVRKFVDKLYGGPDSLDFFYCTDSNPMVGGSPRSSPRDARRRDALGPLIAGGTHPLKPRHADHDVAMDRAVTSPLRLLQRSVTRPVTINTFRHGCVAVC